jgi:hypothetical protein
MEKQIDSDETMNAGWTLRIGKTPPIVVLSGAEMPCRAYWLTVTNQVYVILCRSENSELKALGRDGSAYALTFWARH